MSYIPDRILAGCAVRRPARRPVPERLQGQPARRAGLAGGGWPLPPGRRPAPAPGPTAPSSCARLLGLEDAISLGTPGPTHDARSWTFDLDEGGVDPVLGTERVQENYFKRLFPGLSARDHRPGDRRRAHRRRGHQRLPPDHPGLLHRMEGLPARGAPRTCWPDKLREEMRPVIKRIFTEVNNGVYRCGFAGSQEAYTAAHNTALGRHGLARGTPRQPALPDGRPPSPRPTCACSPPWCASSPVYHGHFKCNRNKLTEMPALSGLRPRSVPDPRLRRHRRLRPDQGALLRGPRGHQPDRASCRWVPTSRAGARRTPGADAVWSADPRYIELQGRPTDRFCQGLLQVYHAFGSGGR